jgi:hypothetical protein
MDRENDIQQARLEGLRKWRDSLNAPRQPSLLERVARFIKGLVPW